MSFDTNPAEERTHLDECIQEIKYLQQENAKLRERIAKLENALGALPTDPEHCDKTILDYIVRDALAALSESEVAGESSD